MKPEEIEELEIDLLLDAVRHRYGYDFRQYARASLERRILHYVRRAGLERPAQLIDSLLYDESSFRDFLEALPVTFSEMFRDPEFYRVVREHVVPVLRTYPFFTVWHAGCATGEEVYSMAILLEEEGLYQRARVYATDLDARALEQARQGIYRTKELRSYTQNYQAAGGRGAFSDYYHALYDSVKLDVRLAERITFAQHNLVTDGVFAEAHLIVCRNVLIYFGSELQTRVIELFGDSLAPRGFLCLGSKESMRFSSAAKRFETICERERVFRKRAVLA